MTKSVSGMVHALEFDCEAPLKFYEHCSACPRFGDKCPDLALGKEILSGKKKLVYKGDLDSNGSIDASAFNCLAPLNYFEKSRKNCAHQGRCREEGLLLALLNGKKELVYTQKAAAQFPRLKRRQEEVEIREDMARKVAG
jgi:hypothetical protein